MISQYRSQLMGLAILFVVLFHVMVPRTSPFYGLCRMGNIGVDIFLFVSGIGLWFAWEKRPQTSYFLKRRYQRIYPTWFIVATAYYLPILLRHELSSYRILDFVGDITINDGFWRFDELTFWYIPATLLLYLVSPFYLKLISKQPAMRWLPVLFIVWCIAVQWVTPIHNTVGHIEIFWSRVPIFFIGMSLGKTVQCDTAFTKDQRLLAIITFIVTLTLCIYLEQELHGRFPLFIERMIYIPLTISGCLLMAYMMQFVPRSLSYALVFLGGLSLEIYLLHAHFILKYLQPMFSSFFVKALLTFVCAIPVAWLLQKIVKIGQR